MACTCMRALRSAGNLHDRTCKTVGALHYRLETCLVVLAVEGAAAVVAAMAAVEQQQQ